MKKIYEILKSKYPDYDISYNSEYDEIFINISRYKIMIFEDYIGFFEGAHEITHSHPNNDSEILYIVDDYIKNRTKIKNSQKVNDLKFYVISMILFVVMLLLSGTFMCITSDKYIDFWWPKLIIILIVFLFGFSVIYGIYKLNIKIKLSKVSDNDLKNIKQFYNYKISNDDIIDDLLYFENVWFCCDMFLNMRKNIFSKSLFDYKIESENPKVNDYYKKAILAISSIYKYYDENGKRNI